MSILQTFLSSCAVSIMALKPEANNVHCLQIQCDVSGVIHVLFFFVNEASDYCKCSALFACIIFTAEVPQVELIPCIWTFSTKHNSSTLFAKVQYLMPRTEKPVCWLPKTPTRLHKMVVTGPNVVAEGNWPTIIVKP